MWWKVFNKRSSFEAAMHTAFLFCEQMSHYRMGRRRTVDANMLFYKKMVAAVDRNIQHVSDVAAVLCSLPCAIEH